MFEFIGRRVHGLRSGRGAGIALTAIASASTATAAPLSITSDGADYSHASTGSPIGTAANFLAVGGAGATPVSQASIMVFALPTLAAGQSIGGQTSLAVTLQSKGASVTQNGDLWGVGNFPAANPNPPQTNYYLGSDAGPGMNSAATDTKLVNNFVVPASPLGTKISSPTGAGNLLQAYIQGFYTANPGYDASVSQRYVYLRVNPDTTSTSTANRFLLNSADATTESLKPVLTLDVVPEPSTATLAAVGAIGLLVRRRR